MNKHPVIIIFIYTCFMDNLVRKSCLMIMFLIVIYFLQTTQINVMKQNL